MRIKTMRTFFFWCETQGLIQRSPVQEIKLLKVEKPCVLAEQLTAIFERANNSFLRDQKKFILSDVSERSLCGEFMKYLTHRIGETEFSSYHVDIEYNRNNGKIKTIIDREERVVNITCDIIVHSRGESILLDNLIAI